MKYELIDYDLWGNKKDGYEVNNAYLTGQFMNIDNKTTKQIIQSLKQIKYIRKGIWYKNFSIEGELEYSLYISYKGNPFCELRAIRSI